MGYHPTVPAGFRNQIGVLPFSRGPRLKRGVFGQRSPLKWGFPATPVRVNKASVDQTPIQVHPTLVPDPIRHFQPQSHTIQIHIGTGSFHEF